MHPPKNNVIQGRWKNVQLEEEAQLAEVTGFMRTLLTLKDPEQAKTMLANYIKAQFERVYGRKKQCLEEELSELKPQIKKSSDILSKLEKQMEGLEKTLKRSVLSLKGEQS